MLRLLAGWLYALGLVAAVGGAVLWLTNNIDVPAEDELVWKKGFANAIRLNYVYDGTQAVLISFRDRPETYVYLSVYPMYLEVRDRLGIYRDIEVLVERDDAGSGDDPIPVWGLIEHDPHSDSTVVTYGEIREAVTRTARSWQNVGLLCLVGGLAAILTGFAIRRAVRHVPRDPTA